MAGRTIGLILGSVIFSVLGQLLLKSGARQLAGRAGLDFFVAAAGDPRVLGGLGAWVASTLCWLYVLRLAPLSRAYGLTSLTYVLLLAVSVGWLGERIRPLHIAGTILVVLGIAFLLHGD